MQRGRTHFFRVVKESVKDSMILGTAGLPCKYQFCILYAPICSSILYAPICSSIYYMRLYVLGFSKSTGSTNVCATMATYIFNIDIARF